MRQFLIFIFVGVALFFAPGSYAIEQSNSLCSLLLTTHHTRKPLLSITPERYLALREIIIAHYQSKSEFDPDLGVAIEVTESHPTKIPLPMGKGILQSKGVLRLDSLKQEWLEFLAYAIFRDDLVNLLQEIQAFKVQIHFYLPEHSLIPIRVDYVPVLNGLSLPSGASSVPVLRWSSENPHLVTEIKEKNLDDVFNAVVSLGLIPTTAMEFIRWQLGFSLSEVLIGEGITRQAATILNELGFVFSPALSHERYWRASELKSFSALYRRAMAAVVKLHELGFVHIDSNLVRRYGSVLKPGLMRRAEFIAAEEEAPLVFIATDLTSENLQGAMLYQGLVAAIHFVEAQGFCYQDPHTYQKCDPLIQK